MGRTTTRWDAHPSCLAVTTANSDDVTTDFNATPDRIYVTCAATVTLSYIWNNTAALGSAVGAAPTNGQSKEQGVRFLRAGESQVIELAGGARYFHHRVSVGTPLLTIEYGRSAGAGS